MSPQGRMLVVVGVLCLGAVLTLMLMAKRYGEILSAREGQAGPAVRSVAWRPADAAVEPPATAVEGQTRDEAAAFLEVRRALRRALDAAPESAGGIDPATTVRLREAARRARQSAGLSREAYARVQDAYSRWKAGVAPQDPVYAPAFDALRQELRAADLGLYDSVF